MRWEIYSENQIKNKAITIKQIEKKQIQEKHENLLIDVFSETIIDEHTSAITNLIKKIALGLPPDMPKIDIPAPIAIWPINAIQSMIETPIHIQSGSQEKEPYYTANLRHPLERAVFHKIDVFDASAKRSIYSLKNGSDSTLMFESRFESGNLQKATKISEFSYNLTIRKDYHTAGHTQWYYFQITNVIAGIDYELCISNLSKPKSLYGDGMRPLLYSEQLASSSNIGWYREGHDISYQTNGRNDEDGLTTQSLKFKIRFPSSKDTVYLAHCYPYTYTNLQKFIYRVKQNVNLQDIVRHKVLGKSLAGNNIDMLCISTKVVNPHELCDRKAVVLIARVHPGESNSSYVIHGLIDYLLGDSWDAQYLRDRYVFKIIPMLNPDGVIVGNYRCNMKGYDLNRQWNIPFGHEENVPEVYLAKKMIERTAAVREISFFCDFHGHNRKHGAFIYGCHNLDDLHQQNKEKIFPLMMSAKIPDHFFYKRCHYRIESTKERTARVILRREFQVINSFTLETSFCGTDLLKYHFDSSDLTRIGRDFIEILCGYLRKYPSIQASTIDWKNEFPILCQDKTRILSVNSESSEADTTSDEDDLRRLFQKKKKVQVRRNYQFSLVPPLLPPKKEIFRSKSVNSSRSNSRPGTPRSGSLSSMANYVRNSSPSPSSSTISSQISFRFKKHQSPHLQIPKQVTLKVKLTRFIEGP
jgi:hypothetical protein